jgi:hypothetical protein
MVFRTLSGQTAKYRDGHAIGVLEKTPNATAEGGLKLDALHRALQEVAR